MTRFRLGHQPGMAFEEDEQPGQMALLWRISGLEDRVDSRAPWCFGRMMRGRRSQANTGAKSADALSIRIDLAEGGRVGPGKIAVLEEIARSGSISAAGRALGISYRRTWKLVEELNQSLGKPVVEAAAGGQGGGGASLTDSGRALVACYRAIEAESIAAARKHLAALYQACGRR